MFKWGSRGREFKSLRPDFFKIKYIKAIADPAPSNCVAASIAPVVSCSPTASVHQTTEFIGITNQAVVAPPCGHQLAAKEGDMVKDTDSVISLTPEYPPLPQPQPYFPEASLKSQQPAPHGFLRDSIDIVPSFMRQNQPLAQIQFFHRLSQTSRFSLAVPFVDFPTHLNC